jgi:hypothetical protein
MRAGGWGAVVSALRRVKLGRVCVCARACVCARDRRVRVRGAPPPYQTHSKQQAREKWVPEATM